MAVILCKAYLPTYTAFKAFFLLSPASKQFLSYSCSLLFARLRLFVLKENVYLCHCRSSEWCQMRHYKSLQILAKKAKLCRILLCPRSVFSCAIDVASYECCIGVRDLYQSLCYSWCYNVPFIYGNFSLLRWSWLCCRVVVCLWLLMSIFLWAMILRASSLLYFLFIYQRAPKNETGTSNSASEQPVCCSETMFGSIELICIPSVDRSVGRSVTTFFSRFDEQLKRLKIFLQ